MARAARGSEATVNRWHLSSKAHRVRAELRHVGCNANTCIPLIAEQSKGTEFQNQWHSKLRNWRCEASLGKAASKRKAGSQQEDGSKEGGAGGSPKHKQLHFTTWNLHGGPQILHLLSLIPGTAPAWGGCPEHTAALPAPAEPSCCPTTQGLPAKAFPEQGEPGAGAAAADPGKQEREAGEALLCCTEKSVISWQMVH